MQDVFFCYFVFSAALWEVTDPFFQWVHFLVAHFSPTNINTKPYKQTHMSPYICMGKLDSNPLTQMSGQFWKVYLTASSNFRKLVYFYREKLKQL